MSYAALLTDRFDDVARFYGDGLGFGVVDQWDRPTARGRTFDLDGMRLEILDNAREREPLTLGEPADRMHLVVEVDSVRQTHDRLGIDAPEPAMASWGVEHFTVRDPDGIPVTFVERAAQP